jgi:hypothetical protein
MSSTYRVARQAMAAVLAATTLIPTAGVAHADPLSDYADRHGAHICGRLDQDSSAQEFRDLTVDIRATTSGLGSADANSIMATAISQRCDRHMRAFAGYLLALAARG